MAATKKVKLVDVRFETIPVTQEKLDEIFFYLFDELAKIGVLDKSQELSDTYNNLAGDNHE